MNKRTSVIRSEMLRDQRGNSGCEVKGNCLEDVTRQENYEDVIYELGIHLLDDTVFQGALKH